MKHKTWFRLVLKAIGVLLIATAAPELISRILQGVTVMSGRGPFSVAAVSNWWITFDGISPVLSLAIGLYLFFGGAWIVNKAIPSNRPYCPDCGYDLTKNTGPRCAECGVALPQP